MRTRGKITAFFLICAFLAVAVLGGLFLARPGAILTARGLEIAIRYFGASWSPSWSKLAFSAHAVALRRHRYALSVDDLCVDESGGALRGCFSRLELNVVVFYSYRGPVLERIDSLRLLAKEVEVDLRRQKPQDGRSAIPWTLLATPIQDLRLEMPDFSVMSATGTVAGSFSLVLNPEERRPLALKTDLLVSKPGEDRRFKAELFADTDLLKGGRPDFVDLTLRADYSNQGSARTNLRIERKGSSAMVSGDGEVWASQGPLRSLRFNACKGSISRPSSTLACGYALSWAKNIAGPFKGTLPKSGRISLGVEREGEELSGLLKAGVDPISAWYRLTGGVALEVRSRLDDPFNPIELKHEARVAAEVPRFEDAVGVFRETKLAVPAPLHTLKGPLKLELVSRGDPRKDAQVLHYELSSDLHGLRQRLALRGSGDISITTDGKRITTYKQAGELILKDVALELPRFDILDPPKTASDKRITAEGVQEAPAVSTGTRPAWPAPKFLPLTSRLAIKTEKPLILYSNLAKEPIPIVVDLTATYPPAAASGTLMVESFAVELFRRNATIDHLNIALSSGSPVGVLEGLVLYKTPDATIHITILGTTEKPRVEFSSVPPMNRQDILALLIFGKSPDTLSFGQASSVGNAESALQSQAFGLFSLYVFGATPVEHVGYNPESKIASVKIRIPGGANLELDSDFEANRELRLRKLLAPHWAIQSELSDRGEQGNSAATFLEWFNRY